MAKALFSTHRGLLLLEDSLFGSPEFCTTSAAIVVASINKRIQRLSSDAWLDNKRSALTPSPPRAAGVFPDHAGFRVLMQLLANLRFVRNSHKFSYMKTTINTAELIRQRIEAMPIGEPFTPTVLLECGTRASINQTLSRLRKAGSIERVTRGVFVRPENSRFVGRVSPSPLKVAETVAKTTGAVLQVHGAEAARRLELTTQVPTQSVFATSGPSKRIRVGKMEISLQHVCQRKLALAGRPAGLALAAMWYLGKTEVTPALVEKIRRKLGSTEFEVLKSATSAMPAWMSDAIFRNDKTAVHV
ncbi:MAG TPA: DUF6088 family protein [Pseudomonadales bacterium]|nr:DUF6088 family protein [Pseudomonadales bacterium]